MDKEKFHEIFRHQMTDKYFTPKELMYSSDAMLYLSPFDYKNYLDHLDELLNTKDFAKYVFPLKTFNSKHFYYLLSNEIQGLLDNYLDLVKESAQKNQPVVSPKFDEDIRQSRIYSEIEGTLNVEEVPTTRKRLIELIENNMDPQNQNDIIIKNMDEAIRFVYTLPKFNKENLLRLYQILSKDCLKEEDKIKEGSYYRDDEVEVDHYVGCPKDLLEEYMDSLFDFVNKELKEENTLTQLFLPHICHYYIVYIHPYFDYNGRTARMVSFWINLLIDHSILPPLISEAINQTKNDYYKALRDTRNSRNDLSYFLLYIFKTTIQYILCYKDLDSIDQHVKNQGNILTRTELNYVKRILITYKGKFAYQDFIRNCQIDITKQGAFKILNKFVGLKILNVVNTPSKVKLFDINHKMVKYTRIPE